MPSSNPAEVRKRLERVRMDLAKCEGEVDAFKREADQERSRLRDLLGCATGEEKAKLAELQQQISSDEVAVIELLKASEQANKERAEPSPVEATSE